MTETLTIEETGEDGRLKETAAEDSIQGVRQYGGYKTVTFTIGAKSIGTVWEGIWSKLWTGMGRFVASHDTKL